MTDVEQVQEAIKNLDTACAELLPGIAHISCDIGLINDALVGVREVQTLLNGKVLVDRERLDIVVDNCDYCPYDDSLKSMRSRCKEYDSNCSKCVKAYLTETEGSQDEKG